MMVLFVDIAVPWKGSRFDYSVVIIVLVLDVVLLPALTMEFRGGD